MIIIAWLVLYSLIGFIVGSIFVKKKQISTANELLGIMICWPLVPVAALLELFIYFSDEVLSKWIKFLQNNRR